MMNRLKQRMFSYLTLLSVAALVTLQVSMLQAQVPAPPSDADFNGGPALQGNPNEPEALLRGPVHEAFAEPYSADPGPGLVINKQPPSPIEELPPEARPEGDNVEWIPGYWGWDEEREDFVWVSGIWRVIPPSHRWVPGYWFETTDGYQWVAGTWVRETAQEIEYLAEAPPESLEMGPVGNAPGDNYFWIPGCWTWNSNRYMWRPGYWSVGYNNWVWVPSRYYWTPYGYAYCRGYWDYPFVNRGYLFAPYYFPQRTYLATGFRFTPGITLSVGLLTNNFWVSANYGHYFFGDYYSNYNRYGFQPWHTYYRSRHGYDPIFAYYQRHHHHHGDRNWNGRDGGSNYYQFISNNFQQRVDNKDHRPPHTWSEQIARYGRGHDHDGDHDGRDGRGGGDRNRNDNVLAQSWRDVVTTGRTGDGDRNGSSKFTNLSESQREQFMKQAHNYRQLSEHRKDTESKHGKGRPQLDGKNNPGLGNGKTRDSDGNQVVGNLGNGIQNRFRLPAQDGAKPDRGNFGRSQGTGDISSTIRSNNESNDAGKDRTRTPGNRPDGNSLGSQGAGKPGNFDFNRGPDSRLEAYQDAIERARDARDNAANSGKPGNTFGNKLPNTDSGSPGRSRLNPPETGSSQLDRSRFDRTTPGKSDRNPFNPGSGTPGNSYVPRSNGPGNAPGTSSNVPNQSVQDAIDRARRATSNPGNIAPQGSRPEPGKFNPPGGNSGNFQAPGSGRSNSFTPPSGGTRTFTPPGKSSFDRSSPRSNDNKGKDNRGGSAYVPGTQGSPAFGSGTPGSNVFRSSPSQGNRPTGLSPTFGGSPSGKSNPSVRSTSPPTGGPSFSRSNNSSSRSSSGYRGPSSSDSKGPKGNSKPKKDRD